MSILLDHNIEGYGVMIWGTLAAEGWLELLPISLVNFSNAGLPFEISDRQLWRFVQEKRMILLTDNRNMKGSDSLEQTIREENTPMSLPVLTIGNVDRLDEKAYREKVVTRLVEIVSDTDNYLGIGRIFIP
ncbi:MAG: ACP S-malonyltransferase [Desulfobacteraceae bacterium IS3]|nr:MAG: ACP S-malonyltransferase [Desulfobacteraceae bacterium IS3]